MTPVEKKYKREYALELLKIAEGDLESAIALSQAKTGRSENIFYMVQQSVEKILKAVLCHKEKRIVHTHDIEALIVLLGDEDAPPSARSLTALTEYATVRRYEEGFEQISSKDIKNALKLGTETQAWAKKIITPKKKK